MNTEKDRLVLQLIARWELDLLPMSDGRMRVLREGSDVTDIYVEECRERLQKFRSAVGS